MACRINRGVFGRMVAAEAHAIGVTGWRELKHDPFEPFSMAEVVESVVHFNRKAIQSLVDEPEQARPIIRNLLRWAKEHGAK